MTKIIGAGGGGGKGGDKGGRTPTTAPDSLDSKSYANVLDLLSEGEIEGLKDGMKSVYFNNTVLQNADGTFNFENVSLTERTGTDPQNLINGFANTGTTVGVTGGAVLQSSPWTETVYTGASHTSGVRNASAPHAIRVVLRIPALQNITNEGDVVGTQVTIKILMEIDGSGTWTEKVAEGIVGRTGDMYKKDYIVYPPSNWNTGIKIRMERVTADAGAGGRLSNLTFFDSYVRIVYSNNTYPNSALVGIRIDAEQFNSIPKRAYHLRGIKIRLPSNATVDSATGRVTYTGTWNGTFQAAQWCNDPAWCLWDLLTSQRYGLGDHLLTKAEKASFNGNASRLDKWAFYSASQYANELVSDGFGGQEPRFSCNVTLRGKVEAFKLINMMASVFRGMGYWSAGSLTLTQDKQQDSSYLFTLANVGPEGFTYSGSSQKTRATAVVVKYFDVSLRTYGYEQVTDTAAIAKYGVVTKNLEAFACTSRGQAQRVGKWLLYSEGNETETVSFKTDIAAGVVVRPGMVIDIADPLKAGTRRGGRIRSATVSTVRIDGDDSNTNLPADGVSYTRTLHVVSPTGTVETRGISSIVKHTGYSDVTVQTDFAAAPNPNSLWIIETTGGTSAENIQTTQWRIISVEEVDGLEYQVVALSYNSSKYANIESGIALTQRDFSNLNEIPSSPVNLRMSQYLYKKGDSVRAKVVFSWDAVLGINEYEVRWRKDSGNWQVHRQQGPDDEILNITPGTFEVKIYSVNSQGVPSNAPLSGSFNATGKTDPPSDVTGFTYEIDSYLGLILKWNKLVATIDTNFKDLDVVGYEIRTQTGGAAPSTWSFDDATHGANLIARVTSNRFKVGTIAPGTINYYIKAYDSEGIYSTNHVSVAVTIAVPAAPSPSGSIDGGSYFLSWDPVSVAGKYTIDYYEVYEDSVTPAKLLDKTDTTRFYSLVNWQGDKTFHVRAVDIAGNAGTAGSVVVTNTPAAAPTIASGYEDNLLKLSWTEVHGNIPTRAYLIKQGTTSQTFGQAAEKGRVKGTAFSLDVTWTTTQRFWVTAVDEHGNLGTAGFVDVTFSPPAIPTLASVFLGEQVKLSWAAVTGSLTVAEYEIRRGATFSSATVLGKVDGTTFSFKVDWGGTQKFWVVGIDVQGNYGAEDDLNVIVSPPNTVPNFRQEVIDNNVLLRWEDATNTLPITVYSIKKGSAGWTNATVIGTKQGLFTTVFETESGTFTYLIKGVDSAGNESTTEAMVTASVTQPPDYVLRSNINSTFNSQTFPGGVATTVTKTNTFADAGTLFANVDNTETYEEHFIGTGSQGSPQFPNFGSPGANVLYALPSETSGSYREEVDYGTVLAGTKVVLALTGSHMAGTTSITPTISVKTTSGGSWIDFAGSSSNDSNTIFSAFATNFRFVRYNLAFSSAGNDDLIKMTALNLKLETKQKGDSGKDLAQVEAAGTYSQSGTTLTVTRAAHALTVGKLVSLDFTSGSTADGVYKIATVPNTDSFTCTQVVDSNNEFVTIPSASTSGNVTLHAGGTAIGFNTDFVDMEGITITPSGSTARIGIYDFVDAPNPKFFKVLLFNTSGTRVGDTSGTNFSWQVRGS